MPMIGFVLFCIGLMIALFAARIVTAKSKWDKEDEEEMKLLISGAVMAVRLAGFVVAAVGLIFLMLR